MNQEGKGLEEVLGFMPTTKVNAGKGKNSCPGLLESRFIEDQVLFFL